MIGSLEGHKVVSKDKWVENSENRYSRRKKSSQFCATGSASGDANILGWQLIKSMSLMVPMGKKL